MPYQIRMTSKNKYGVFNIQNKIWKSYNTTLDKASAQLRLLNYIDGIKYRKLIK